MLIQSKPLRSIDSEGLIDAIPPVPIIRLPETRLMSRYTEKGLDR